MSSTPHPHTAPVAAVEPPSVGALIDALAALGPGAPRRQALMHLATPVTVVAGAGIDFAEGRYTYRDYVHPAHGEDAVAIAGDVLAVVRAGHRRGDTYLSLVGGADPLSWVKVLRSGWRQIGFGSDVLLGQALVGVPADLPAEDARAAVEQVLRAAQGGELADGQAIGSGLRAEVADGAVNVGRPSAGTASALPQVDGVSGPWCDPRGPGVHAASLATSLATVLGARGMELTEVGSRAGGAHDFEVDLQLEGTWRALVPVTVTPGGELVGVDADTVLTEAAPGSGSPLASAVEGLELPEGFSWAGRSLWSDGLAARHDRTGVLALLQRT